MYSLHVARFLDAVKMQNTISFCRPKTSTDPSMTSLKAQDFQVSIPFYYRIFITPTLAFQRREECYMIVYDYLTLGVK
jgi:hypothetical protein